MTLDIPEAQVAVFFEDDPDFVWHVRVLLIRLYGSRWIVGTPTLSVQAIDLADFRVLPLARKAEFPVGIRGQVFYVNVITDQELDLLRGDACALAMILGAATATTVGASIATWHVSDPSHPRYAEAVPLDVSRNPARCVVRGNVALVELEDDGDSEWTTAELVLVADLQRWKKDKKGEKDG